MRSPEYFSTVSTLACCALSWSLCACSLSRSLAVVVNALAGFGRPCIVTRLPRRLFL